jgi:hypothetical protein
MWRVGLGSQQVQPRKPYFPRAAEDEARWQQADSIPFHVVASSMEKVECILLTYFICFSSMEKCLVSALPFQVNL